MVGVVTAGDGRAPVRTAPAAIADVERVCTLDVRGETLREALTHVASRDGWDVVRNQRPGAVTVRDRVVALEAEQSSSRTVLVVEPLPLQCQRAFAPSLPAPSRR